jgi:hypothetical protein
MRSDASPGGLPPRAGDAVMGHEHQIARGHAGRCCHGRQDASQRCPRKRREPPARPIAARLVPWSIQIKDCGSPAQPSPRIRQCLNGGYGWLEVKCHRCDTKAGIRAGACPASPRYPDLEAGGGTEMPVMPKRSVHAACAHDQADGTAGNHAVQMGAFGRGAIGTLSSP